MAALTNHHDLVPLAAPGDPHSWGCQMIQKPHMTSYGVGFQSLPTINNFNEWIAPGPGALCGGQPWRRG